MATKNVKTNLLNHSEAKVKLLKKYLEKYLSIISNERYISKIKISIFVCVCRRKISTHSIMFLKFYI